LVLVLGCVGLAACGGGGGAEVDNGGGAEPVNGDGNGGGNGGGESLEDILGLGADITAVSYDSVVTAPGAGTFTMHVWLEEDKMRTETDAGEGMGTIVSIADLDAQVMYQYLPDQNMAYRMSYTQEENTVLTETQSISGYSPTVIGTETMDGKVCLVVEYSYAGVTGKMWIWKEYGFPIRIETTTAEGTAIVECRNIEFGDIPDSMFEIPAGVQIIDI
jgi:outer membrane lipoprotein-sorting protein